MTKKNNCPEKRRKYKSNTDERERMKLRRKGTVNELIFRHIKCAKIKKTAKMHFLSL